jgi:pimeloyl-ACP methyl ester carboxylesterase
MPESRQMAAILGGLMPDGSVPYGHGWVAYRDFGGEGPAVMLMHGLGGNLAHWRRVAPLLQERYRLIAIDLPSHGASTASAAYSFEYDIGALEEVRQSLCLDRPALVGHSYGGWLAVSLGASRPGRYRGVVNIDGIGFVDAENGLETPPEALSEEDLTNAGDDVWLEAAITRDVDEAASIGLPLDRDDEILRRAYQLGDDGRWHRSPTIARFVEIDQALQALRLMPAYTASSCRIVTVIAEHRDTPNAEAAEVSRRRADRARAALDAAGAELDSLPSGHFPHIEMPELTAERFSSWVGG